MLRAVLHGKVLGARFVDAEIEARKLSYMTSGLPWLIRERQSSHSHWPPSQPLRVPMHHAGLAAALVAAWSGHPTLVPAATESRGRRGQFPPRTYAVCHDLLPLIGKTRSAWASVPAACLPGTRLCSHTHRCKATGARICTRSREVGFPEKPSVGM